MIGKCLPRKPEAFSENHHMAVQGFLRKDLRMGRVAAAHASRFSRLVSRRKGGRAGEKGKKKRRR